MIYILREVLDSVLTYSKIHHPRESILLLRGEVKKMNVTVKEVIIPPSSIHGRGFTSFPLVHLPIDFSIVGTSHSHPSGVLRPSITDLNHVFGRFLMIVGYPYNSERDIAIFNREGKALKFTVVEEGQV